MKKRTISKLKSIFGAKKCKRQLHQEQVSKSSRSPSPEAVRAASPAINGESFRHVVRTPPPHGRVGPPPSPPVPTNPVAPVAPEPAGPQPLMPCAVCGRTFLPQSLSKHVKICEKMTIKKRKTFDSFRQRREGTDLEQYLPKNFGLPENSPFLEKSPPVTAKPTPKPKPQSIKSARTKPNAELQRCPHCNRAFGVRAFERHVEWCADKAKILPAAPAQPPPHIADAKQRLNARTQYRAPLAPRGRRSSQTREKSAHSRSTSVDSSHGGSSPPPPREYGDYKHGRNRASESQSSNDCHDEPPHMPVIRNSRNSVNTSGDANVKARQARLARDLSNSRKTNHHPQEPNNQDPQPKPVQQSKIEPNAKKNISQQKLKNIKVKHKQQLEKLEKIASKYNQTPPNNVKDKPEKHSKSKLPVLKKENTIQANKKTTKPLNTPSQAAVTVNETNNKKKVTNTSKREVGKITKETSISLDSLDENIRVSSNDRNCQSIGINTELLCVPCVIHDGVDEKKPSKEKKLKSNVTKSKKTQDNIVTEPCIEFIYKNPTISSNTNQIHNEEILSVRDEGNDYSTVTTTYSGNINTDEIESRNDFDLDITRSSKLYTNATEEMGINPNVTQKSHSHYSNAESNSEELSHAAQSLSEEHFDEDSKLDVSAEMFDDDSIENKYDNDNNNENGIECRHGSGETYTKIIEDPADLEEFMSLTDKLLTNAPTGGQSSNIDVDIDNFHTPKTNSIEAINEKRESAGDKSTAFTYSDDFAELKSDLKNLLESVKNEKMPVESSDKQEDNKTDSNESDARKVCDMEHITVYQLKFYDKKEENTTRGPSKKRETSEKRETLEIRESSEKSTPRFSLPSISESNKAGRRECNKKIRNSKPNRKYKMLGEQARKNKEYTTFIVDQSCYDNSDSQSVNSEAPPLKLPRIETKRLDDNYDPFISAARQMKELMSSDTNIPKKTQNSTTKDHSRTLPALQPTKEKSTSSYLRSDNTKMMKDTLNKTYQKTPTLQRMKSFGSSNNENTSSTFGARCSSFRLTKNDKQSTPKLNTTFTKSSKENISTTEKNHFNRNSALNRSFSSYSTSCYSTPKPKDKIPKIATSMYHSFQRTTIKQPVKLDKIKRDDVKKDFVNLDAILTDDTSSMTDSNYIDPRLINENDNLPIDVNTILNNPDIISSMESLLTTENLPAKFESFSSVNQSNNKIINNNNTEINQKSIKNELNNNVNLNSAPTVDELNMQYDKLMYSLEQSIASKTSIRDDDSLCEDFDLEEFMTSFDEEIHKHKTENKRTCSSTTRVVKQSDLADSNRASEQNSMASSPKPSNTLIPVNKSMSLNFSNNNVMSESFFPSSVKRSTSLLDSIHKKTVMKTNCGKTRHKSDQLEQDIMQSLKDFDKFYESEKHESQPHKKESPSHNGTARRDSRIKSEKRTKTNEISSNGNFTPNGKSSNDSAYSSLNRLSPSKLSIANSKESNGMTLEQIPAGSDSGSHKEDVRSISSDEFLAMERSAELDEPLSPPEVPYKEPEPRITEKRVSSRSSRRSSAWRGASLSSSGSDASLSAPRMSRFCHECGSKFPDTAKFCIECGVKRLVV